MPLRTCVCPIRAHTDPHYLQPVPATHSANPTVYSPEEHKVHASHLPVLILTLSRALSRSLLGREREPERRRRAATAIPNAERRSRSGSAPALLGFRVCFSFHACLGVPWVAPSPPLLQMLWRSSSSGASLRPTATTFTCARSSSRVTAAPIPVPAPVTTAQRAVAADILCVSANKKKIAPCSPRSSNNKHTHCVLVDYF